MNKHFKAGYIADSIAKVINEFKNKLDRQNPTDQIQLDQINGLLQYVCSFDVEFPYNHEPNFENINPVLATINNIITRGLPTRAPLIIEKKFSEIGLTEQDTEPYEFNFPKHTKEIQYELIFELLHILEPQLEINRKQYKGELGSQAEWNFLNNELGNFPYAKQIFQAQRDFATINPKMVGGKHVDFSFEFPYFNTQTSELKKNGIIIEFDGPHHETKQYKYYDKYRDEAADEKNYETLRQKIGESGVAFEIEKALNQPIFNNFKNNFQRDYKKFQEEYTLIFVPLAVARVQKTLIERFIVGLNLFKPENKVIKIAIIERDFPCGALAIKGLKQMFDSINAILEDSAKLILPQIELSIFETSKYVYNSQFHLDYPINEEYLFNENEFDIIIDHSILRRSNIYKETDFISDKSIKIRSSHYSDNSFGTARRIYCSDLLKYVELTERKGDGSYIPIEQYEPHINFFIQEIFRKTAYREGQLPIIDRALRQLPVIGLLPTGGGKSLTFQLPAFLQPGLCLIIDPIKSLMEDQVRVLKENWIDCCNFINSNLEKKEKNKRLIDFRYGETLFMFVSPERFVMQDFRTIIQKIDKSPFSLGFSYCVIDEVHCVSEWGHDFRSTYLMLGKNAQLFCSVKKSTFEERKVRNNANAKSVTLIGLTATASFDVLADIEREIQIQSDDVANAIIMIENTIRPELFFRVINVTDKIRINELNSNFSSLSKNLQQINNEKILIQSQKHHFDEFEPQDFAKRDEKKKLIFDSEGKLEFKYDSSFLLKYNLATKTQNDFYSIMFCPVKGETLNFKGEYSNEQGVMFVHQNINSKSKGYFFASDDDFTNKEVQKHFEYFVTGKTMHMVCTKAFGMGIDKKNIRSTYHFVYSSSLESLVQEAGRSGRDKKISEANILVSKNKVYRLSVNCLYIEENTQNAELIPIYDTFHRKSIRKLIDRKAEDEFKTEEEIIESINATIGSLKKWNNEINGLDFLSETEKKYLVNRLKQFIKPFYTDRDIHNFFFENNFRGLDTEISQFHSLIKSREFLFSSKLYEIAENYNSINATNYRLNYWKKGSIKRIYIETFDNEKVGFINVAIPVNKSSNEIIDDIIAFIIQQNNGNNDLTELLETEIKDDNLNNGTLEEIFNLSKVGTFEFFITSEKIFPDNIDEIFIKLLKLNGQSVIFENFATKIDTIIINSTTFGNFKTSLLNTFKWFYLNEKINRKGLAYDYEYIEKLDIAFNEKSKGIVFAKIIYKTQIERSLKKSAGDFWNFLLILEECIDKLKFNFSLEKTPNNIIERALRFIYNRNRYFKPTNDTGRLIYRMHSMGFLVDYMIDYNQNNLYKCTFEKRNSIDEYVTIIENYLRRYLSEQTAIEERKKLESRLTKDTAKLIDDILVCLYFLSEFSYKEIASKRKRATDEIENVLNTSITEEKYINDWYLQNTFIKEQIYFYFNAKYARPFFEINVNGKDENYSLLKYYEDNKQKRIGYICKDEILTRFLSVFKLGEGTEQNNYKHMIGSCKKILRSLSETDLKNEWILRLLKAFAMYSVNNPSYIQEANIELETGFINLYKDKDFHNNNFGKVEPIFINYFKLLMENIEENNLSINMIEMIRNKLLQLLQEFAIDEIINKSTKLISLQYARS